MAVHSPYVSTPTDFMMDAAYDNSAYGRVEILLDDVAKQMASSNLSRYSRGSSGFKTGGSLRANSPRSSIGVGRRKTVIADAGYRQRLGLHERNPSLSGQGSNVQNSHRKQNRAQRPVSWHPSSAHLTPQPTAYPSYTFAGNEAVEEFPVFDMAPAPPVYSGYTSPASAFSPQCLPYSQPEQPFHYPEAVSMPSNPAYDMYQTSGLFDQTTTLLPPSTNDMDPTMYSHMDWNFPTNTFETSTAPPTPQNLLPVQHPEPAFPPEESIPYQPLEDEDDSGEELIGMGLYDTPDAGKALPDPQLDNYRAMMMSQLLGPAYQRPEPKGKGLKLEETWSPPPDNGDDDDDDADAEGGDEDADQDGEAEDDDEEPQQASVTEKMNTQTSATNTNTTSIPQFGESELRFLQGSMAMTQ